MFTKNKVSQSMIDAVKGIINESGTPIKEPTSTGMRVYGRSYGNSAKAKQDQTSHELDKVKGPKDKEMKEASKPDSDKPVKEELKGNQDKIDANHNDKIDAQDFKILKGKKKVTEDMHFAKKLLEAQKLKQSPAKNQDVADKSYLKDKPGSVKSDLKNLGRFLTGKKETNEEVEELDEVSLKTATSAYVKRVGKDETGADPKAAKTIQHIANKHGVVGVARAAKAADKEYGLNDPVHNKRKDFVKGVMSGVKEEVELDEADTIYVQHSNGAQQKVKLTPDMKAAGKIYVQHPSGPQTKVKIPTDAKKINKEEVELDEANDKKVPNLPIDNKGIDKHYGGSVVKMGAAAKKAGFSDARIRKTGLDYLNRKEEVGIEEGKRPETDDAPPFEQPYTKTSPVDVKDKSGAVHTPMSRARDLARAAMKKVKTEMLGKTGTSEGKKW